LTWWPLTHNSQAIDSKLPAIPNASP